MVFAWLGVSGQNIAILTMVRLGFMACNSLCVLRSKHEKARNEVKVAVFPKSEGALDDSLRKERRILPFCGIMNAIN